MFHFTILIIPGKYNLENEKMGFLAYCPFKTI